MTNKEKAKMEDILMRHLEEDDRLCPIAEAMPGDYVTVVLPYKLLWAFRVNIARHAIVRKRDLSRPDDGVEIELLNDRAETDQLPLDYPCFVTPPATDEE